MDKVFAQYKKWKTIQKEQEKVEASQDDNIEMKLFSSYVGKKLDYDVMCELENLYDEYLIEQETFDEE